MRMIRKVTMLSVCAALLAALPAAAAETIKIGAILAVTGPAAFLGAPEAKTLEMLAAQVNAAGGIKGMKVELVIKDSAGDAEKALSMAKQLVEEEKVFAIIGPSTSGESMKIKQYMDENATLLLSCAAAEAITTPILKWVFKTPQNDANAVRWIFGDMKKKGLKKIGVLASNTGFGKAGKGQLEKLAPEFGIEIAIAETYDKDEVDLDAVVTKLKAKDVQAVVNWSIEPAQSKVPVSIRKMGWNVPVYQSHGFGNIKYAEACGPAAEGILFPAGRLLVADVLPDTHPQKALLHEVQEGLRGGHQGGPEHLRRPRLRRVHAARQGHRGRRRRQGEGPRGPRRPQGLRRHRRHLQLLAPRTTTVSAWTPSRLLTVNKNCKFVLAQ